PADGRRGRRGTQRRPFHLLCARLRARRGVPTRVRGHRQEPGGVGRVPVGPPRRGERGRVPGHVAGAPVSDVTLDEVCVVAVAECFRGDGEILANPIGNVPMIGGRLARESFEPDLVMTDGEAMLVADPMAVGVDGAERVVEAWIPYRAMFDVVWSGRRHIMMGASQVDRYGNQNIAAIGDYAVPKAMLLGFRGAPGNTINNVTSYWVPSHTRNVFVDRVDTVCGIGYD